MLFIVFKQKCQQILFCLLKVSWNIEWNIQLKRKQSIRCIYYEGGKTIKRKAVN